MANTKVSYLYRDASNYKVHNEAVIKGGFTPEQAEAVMACLDMGENFIPCQVGLPEKRFDNTTEDDHCWFELGEHSFEETDAPATVDMTMDGLVQRFMEAKGRWDEHLWEKQA